MATQRNQQRRRSSSGRTGSRFVPFLLGFLCASAAFSLAGWLYLRSAHPHRPLAGLPSPGVSAPVAPPRTVPLEQPPFGISEDVFEAGARTYVQQCAVCHGRPGRTAPAIGYHPPRALQLWEALPGAPKHVGVSAQPPGRIFAVIRDGSPGSAMPAYQHRLTSTSMWQLALLLKNADQVLPDPVINLLRQPIRPPSAAAP